MKSAIIPIPGRMLQKPKPLSSHTEEIDQMIKNIKMENNCLKFKEKIFGRAEAALLEIAFINYDYFDGFHLQFLNCDIEAIALECILRALTDKRSLKRMVFDFSGSTFDDESGDVFNHYLKHLPSLEKVRWNFSNIRGAASLIPKIINGFWEYASQPKNLNMSINLSGADLQPSDLESIFWMLKIVSTTKRKNPRMHRYYSSLSIGQFKLILSASTLTTELPYSLTHALSRFGGLNLDTLSFDFSKSTIDSHFASLISSFFQYAYSRNCMFISFEKTNISTEDLSKIMINACASSIVALRLNLSHQELLTEGWAALARGIHLSNQLIDMKLILDNIKINRLELESLLLAIFRKIEKEPSLEGFKLDLSGVFLDNEHIALLSRIIDSSTDLNQSSFSFNLNIDTHHNFEHFLNVLTAKNKNGLIQNFSLTIENGPQDFDVLYCLLNFIEENERFINFKLIIKSLPINLGHIQKLSSIFLNHSNLSGLHLTFKNYEFPTEYATILIEHLKQYVLNGNLLINFSIALKAEEDLMENEIFDLDLYDSVDPFKIPSTDPILLLMNFSKFHTDSYPSWIYKLYFNQMLSEEELRDIEKTVSNLVKNPGSLPLDLKRALPTFLSLALIDSTIKKEPSFPIALKDYLKRILSETEFYTTPSELKLSFLKQFIFLNPKLAKFCIYEIRKEEYPLSFILPTSEMMALILQLFLKSLYQNKWGKIQAIFQNEISSCFHLALKKCSINEQSTFSRLYCTLQDHRVFDVFIRYFKEVCELDEFQKIYQYPNKNYQHLLYLLSNLSFLDHSIDIQKKIIEGLCLLFNYPYDVILKEANIALKVTRNEMTFKEAILFFKNPFEKPEEILTTHSNGKKMTL